MPSRVSIPRLRELDEPARGGIPLHGTDPEKTLLLESLFSGIRQDGSEIWRVGKYAQIAQFGSRGG
jgi:hypothetical protein